MSLSIQIVEECSYLHTVRCILFHSHQVCCHWVKIHHHSLWLGNGCTLIEIILMVLKLIAKTTDCFDKTDKVHVALNGVPTRHASQLLSCAICALFLDADVCCFTVLNELFLVCKLSAHLDLLCVFLCQIWFGSMVSGFSVGPNLLIVHKTFDLSPLLLHHCCQIISHLSKCLVAVVSCSHCAAVENIIF